MFYIIFFYLSSVVSVKSYPWDSKLWMSLLHSLQNQWSPCNGPTHSPTGALQLAKIMSLLTEEH